MLLLIMVLLMVLVVCKVVLSPVVLGLSFAIHVKVDETEPVSGIFTVPPEQIVAEELLVTVELGLTVIVNEMELPVQPFAEGVTDMVPLIGLPVELVEVKEGMSPEPEALRPMAGLVFVQLKVVPVAVPVKFMAVVFVPAQTV